MGGAVAGSIGYALGIAISPIPVAALILTLLSVRPRANSLAFAVGWVTGVAGIAAIAAFNPKDLVLAATGGTEIAAAVLFAVGVLFVVEGLLILTD